MLNQGQSSKKPLAGKGAEQGLLSAMHQRRIRIACKISGPCTVVTILEFADRGETILQTLEECDIQRTVLLT